jgi:hypothetical protein
MAGMHVVALTCPRCKSKVQAPSNLATLNCSTPGCRFTGANPNYVEQWIAQPTTSAPAPKTSKRWAKVAGIVVVVAVVAVASLAAIGAVVGNLVDDDQPNTGSSTSKAVDLILVNNGRQAIWITCWVDHGSEYDGIGSSIQIQSGTAVGLRLDDSAWTNATRIFHLCQSSWQPIVRSTDDAVLDGWSALVSRFDGEPRCLLSEPSACSHRWTFDSSGLGPYQ